MNLAVVGVGDAGARLANQLLHAERRTGRNLCRGNVLVVNTEPPRFDVRDHVPDERRLLVGDVHREVDGRGTEGDPDLGAEVARDEHHDIIRAFDLIELHEVDGVLVVAGLGGGTGAGVGAVVLEELQQLCDEPVYALGVLPAEDEGPERALAASRALQSFVTEADNVIGFDNEAWPPGKGEDHEAYRATNEALATRIVSLFAAGEFDSRAQPENRLDPSDIIRTLDCGGVSSIGYARTRVPGTRRSLGEWLGDLTWKSFVPFMGNGSKAGPPATDAVKINQLVREAAHSDLTLPCDIASAERALIMLSGPAPELSRKGFESGRYWLEQEADIVEVKAGDEPIAGARYISATVLFSNVTDVPRIEALKEQAAEA